MAHIDWMTIVGRREVDQTDWSTSAAYRTAEEWLVDRSPTFMEAVGVPHEWEVVKPRAPYSYARRSHDCTRTLYVHPLASHFTLEISGQHCGRIQREIPSLCRDYLGAFSRMDLAVDMETTVTPLEFDSQTTPDRIKTRSRMESTSGQTVYSGSRSSERFARVYRYFPPHPRAHLLRAEFQLKGRYANALAEAIADGEALSGLAAAQGQHFGFQHPCWQPGEPVRPLKVQSHAQSGNTVSWLTSTVAPLMRRLQREGKLDLQMWFEEFVMKDE